MTSEGSLGQHAQEILHRLADTPNEDILCDSFNSNPTFRRLITAPNDGIIDVLRTAKNRWGTRPRFSEVAALLTVAVCSKAARTRRFIRENPNLMDGIEMDEDVKSLLWKLMHNETAFRFRDEVAAATGAKTRAPKPAAEEAPPAAEGNTFPEIRPWRTVWFAQEYLDNATHDHKELLKSLDRVPPETMVETIHASVTQKLPSNAIIPFLIAVADYSPEMRRHMRCNPTFIDDAPLDDKQRDVLKRMLKNETYLRFQDEWQFRVPVPLDQALTCWHCGKQEWRMKHCSTCRLATYCSRDCQEADWRDHKPTCTPPNDELVLEERDARRQCHGTFRHVTATLALEGKLGRPGKTAHWFVKAELGHGDTQYRFTEMDPYTIDPAREANVIEGTWDANVRLANEETLHIIFAGDVTFHVSMTMREHRARLRALRRHLHNLRKGLLRARHDHA